MYKIIIYIFFSFILSACNNSSLQNNIKYIKTNNYKTNKIEEFEDTCKKIKSKENSLSNQLRELHGLEHVETKLIGNIALVSIQVYGKLTDQKLLLLKKEIETSLKKLDPNIGHVKINANKEIFENAFDLVPKNKNIDKDQEVIDNLIKDSIPSI